MTQLRVLVPGRKSRKGDDSDEATRYARQDHKTAERAERDGHFVVATVHDTISSQSMPWERPELKKWLNDPAKLAMFDALLVETDRLSRGDDHQWHDIESWCYDHDKKILTTDGVQFPPRDDSDRYQWLGLKRRARTYWEDVRDKHAAARSIVQANHAALGRAPFGYSITGEKMHKQFVIDPVTGALAREAFQRIADGDTATSVAIWLSDVTGQPWRVKRVTDMISRRTYLGERDGHRFEPLVTGDLFNSANEAMASRARATGGRRTQNTFSGMIYCPCGAPLYRHQSVRNGQPVGGEKYRCSRGRRGTIEETCGNPPVAVATADAMIDAFMRRFTANETVDTVTGGDAGRQIELSAIQKKMGDAMARRDMAGVTRLATEYEELAARPAEPARMVTRETGRTYAARWADSDLTGRRAMLADSWIRLVVTPDGVHAEGDVPEDAVLRPDP